MHKRLSACALLLMLAAIAPASADTPIECAPEAGGGEWASYGGDLLNSRTQFEETRIGPEQVPGLTAAWSIRTANVEGAIQSTPVVVDGCVFVTSGTSSSGFVMALNAETGETVWKVEIPVVGGSGLGTAIVGSPAVARGLVYALINQKTTPFAVALDQQTGAEVWRTTVDDYPDNFINSSAVVYDDKLFVGISGAESTAHARGGYAILDADTGELLVHRYTITDEEYEAGYRGVSIWTTAGVDEDGYAYVGGGNPASKQIEHRYANALLKIDLNDERATFGEIVDAFKGNVDQYYPGLDRQPACDTYPTDIVWSPTCAQLDLDFGASPSIWVNSEGRRMVGALQKSGIFYAVYADNMQQAWSAVIGLPGAPVNAASSAMDGEKVYAVGSPGSQMFALTGDRGRTSWVAPVADGTHYQGTTVANGVVYTVDTKGFLDAYDAETGVVLAHRPLALDTGGSAAGLYSSGIAIARSTIYVASGRYLVAYK